MLLAVAVGVGLSYFVLGWVSNNASAVSPQLHKERLNLTMSVHRLILSPGIFSQHHH